MGPWSVPGVDAVDHVLAKGKGRHCCRRVLLMVWLCLAYRLSPWAAGLLQDGWLLGGSHWADLSGPDAGEHLDVSGTAPARLCCPIRIITGAPAAAEKGE